MGAKNEALPNASGRMTVGMDVREYSLKHTQALFANAQSRVSKTRYLA